MSLTQQQKDFIQKLWADNFLNFKEAAKEVSMRDIKKLYFAIEFRNTIIDKKGIPFDWALEALKAISDSKKMKIIIYTPYTIGSFNEVMTQYFFPKNIRWDFYNENPDLSFIDADPRRINYDILIDYRAGFRGENAWFWIKNLVECLDRMLPNQNEEIPLSSPNPFDTDQFKIGTGEIKVARPVGNNPMRVYNHVKGIWEDKK